MHNMLKVHSKSKDFTYTAQFTTTITHMKNAVLEKLHYKRGE